MKGEREQKSGQKAQLNILYSNVPSDSKIDNDVLGYSEIETAWGVRTVFWLLTTEHEYQNKTEAENHQGVPSIAPTVSAVFIFPQRHQQDLISL